MSENLLVVGKQKDGIESELTQSQILNQGIKSDSGFSKDDYLKLKEDIKEMQKLNEELEINIQNGNKDFSVLSKKYDTLKKDLSAQKAEKSRLDAKISQLEKYCDKIKAKRDDYKKAWDKTEDKI